MPHRDQGIDVAADGMTLGGSPWLIRRWRQSFALDVRSLAVYRMALGLLLCTDFIQRLRSFRFMFAVDGIFPPAAIRRSYADPTVWSLAFLHDTTWWNGVILGLEGVAGVLLVVGLATRFGVPASRRVGAMPGSLASSSGPSSSRSVRRGHGMPGAPQTSGKRGEPSRCARSPRPPSYYS
jgi:hypothetical protein